MYYPLSDATTPEPLGKLTDMRKICLRCGSKFASRAEFCPHDGSLLVSDDEIADPLLGTVLLEQFRIEEQIGTGGMGTVYRAHQSTVGRDVAIKVLKPELARDEQAVFRFEREARVAISLDHPNLVRVFLSGRLSDGRLYIVMELLEGRSLADELDELGLPSLERALVMTMKLCAGLGAVHAAGIVHRDIKPENIYLVRRGTDPDFVKLVDFGIARILEPDGASTTTQSGRVFGTATYISPEAALGEPTDQRSDIYSLGVLTYQLLTGELPFEGKTAGAVLMQHVHQAPPLLQSKGRGVEVSDDVASVVMRSLGKDPDARQQTLAEFLNSLAEASGGAGLLKDARPLLLGTVWGDDLAPPGSYLAELLGSSAPPSIPSPLADTQLITSGSDPDDDPLLAAAPKPFGTTSFNLATATGPKRGGRKWLWASLGLLAIVLVGVVTGTLWSQRAPRAVAEPQPVEPVTPVAEPPEPDPQVADVGTDAPLIEPVVIDDVVVDEPVVEEDPPEKPKAKARSRKKKKKKVAPESASVPVPAPAPAPVPASASASADGQGAEVTPNADLETDDGIDWTIPDFKPEAPPSTATPETPPPTGTPDAEPRNPVVIDEPPSQ